MAPVIRCAAILSNHETIPHGNPEQHGTSPPRLRHSTLDHRCSCAIGHSAISALRLGSMPVWNTRKMSQRTGNPDGFSCYKDLRAPVRPESANGRGYAIIPMQSLSHYLLGLRI